MSNLILYTVVVLGSLVLLLCAETFIFRPKQIEGHVKGLRLQDLFSYVIWIGFYLLTALIILDL